MVDFKRPVTEFSYTTPALFRLLYGTGLRISEALHLETQDVHLDKKYLVLHNTKNRVDRMIPFSESVGNALQQYSIYKQSIFPQNLKYFFAKPENTPWSTSRAYVYFRTILLRANIPHNANGPRLHDFRHTFSVHSLAEMASQGLDLYYGLPILSKYLGHTSLGSHRALCTVNCWDVPRGFTASKPTLCLCVPRGNNQWRLIFLTTKMVGRFR